MSQPILYLAKNETTSGSKDPVLFNGTQGKANIYFEGNFGGATVALQMKPNNYNGQTPEIDFTPVIGADAINEPGVSELIIMNDTHIRAIISNASGATNLNILLKYDL